MLLLHAATARSVDTGTDMRLAQWARNEMPALEVPDELAKVWLDPSQCRASANDAVQLMRRAAS